MTKKTMKMGWVSLAVAMALGTSALAADVKIGVIDMQKALQTVDAGKKARAELEKDFNARKKELQSEEEKLKKLDEEFKKQSLALSDEARSKKQMEFQQKVMKLQEMVGRSQQEIQKREAELTGPLIEKIRAVITDVAKTKGFSMIIEKNAGSVLFHNEKDDVTSEVVEAFNKKNKS